MKKKYFPLVTIVGAILIFSILPILNYLADPSRILHHDYNYRYKKFHPNKLSLKTLYLLENKNKYDTLVYGSSRGEFVDVSLISKDAYNMTHGFGTLMTYLTSLKTLLSNDVEIKHVWVCINDYDIWKDQTNSLVKLIYQNNLFYDIGLYTRSLFTLNPKYIQILKDKEPLLLTQEVTDPNQRTIWSRKQEHIVDNQSNRNIPAATLGYTGEFRIDKAINEMAQIKQLCEKHNIKLTVLMYPIYWKTYLSYNQDKVEEFKEKLVKVTDFYDFYDVGTISLNQHNWFEGSHFVPSIGDYIINSVQKKQHLVTKNNINSRIQETQQLLKNMPIMETGGIYTLDEHVELQLMDEDIIFDIENKQYSFFKNNDFTIKKRHSYMEVEVEKNDPLIILNTTKSKAKESLLHIEIKSPYDTLFQLYFKSSKSAQYSEANRYNILLKKGINTMRIVIPSNYINNELRVDFARKIGTYKINNFKVYDIMNTSPQ